MEGLVLIIILLASGFWCLQWLFGKIPGVSMFSGFVPRIWDGIFNQEKQSGARFQTERESSSFLSPRNRGLVLDGTGRKRLGEKESFEHLAVISPTGGGKTTRYVAPNLLTLDDCSIVVTDPSGELYQKTSGAMARRGFRMQILNFDKPDHSFGYNPISKIRTYEEINNLAQVLMQSTTPETKPGDEIWQTGPQTIFSCLIRCLLNTGEPEWCNLHNLLHLLQNFGQHGEGIASFMARYVPDQMTLNQWKGFISSNEKMLSSFLTMAKNALQVLDNNPAIATMLARNEVDFDAMRQEKTVLYLVVPGDRIKLYSPLLNLFYTQFFAAQQQARYITQGLPLHILYDEFGHSMIPGFDTVSTTIRKYRVSLSIILQDYAQLRKQYGDHGAQTILSGGVRTKLFYPGLDTETADKVEKMLGKVRYESKSRGRRDIRDVSLMNADRISRMPADQAICISTNQEPILLKTTPCFQNRHLDSLMGLPPHPLPRPLPSRQLHYIPLD